jgi:hypothetical protein
MPSTRFADDVMPTVTVGVGVCRRTDGFQSYADGDYRRHAAMYANILLGLNEHCKLYFLPYEDGAALYINKCQWLQSIIRENGSW